MKSVYLNYTSESNEHYLTLDGYLQVRELVMKLRMCRYCERPFEPYNDRPCVGLHLCLSCFLDKHPNLKFLGIEKVNNDGEATYTFIHEDGKVYTSRENYSDKPSEDIAYTLRQYAFNPPQTYKPFRAEKEIQLYPGDFQIYGDLNASVVVADYNDYYRKDHITFLLYKNGGFKELTKRGEGRTLFAKAEAILEKLKLPNGEYLIDGSVHMRIYDGDLYRVISKLESAMYDISLQFGLPALTQAVETSESSEETEESKQEAQEVSDTEEPETSEKEAPKRRGRPRLTIVQPTESVPVESRVIGEINPIEEKGDEQIETQETTDPGNSDHV